MESYKVFIGVDSLIMGGIQKSLIAFLGYIKDFCDIDIAVWYDKRQESINLPEYVNRIHVMGTESVRTAYRCYGLFSRDFSVSAFSAFRDKRWLAIPRIKKKYDIAVAYSQVSSLKYYIIDKVTAERKFAFYHNGAYVFTGKVKRFDLEYYQQYDKIFAVSAAAQKVLLEALPPLRNVTVLPNLIDVKGIRESSEEPCPEFPAGQELKLLTVGRLSPEKNPLRIIETAKLLNEKRTGFIWIVIGDGELRDALKNAIIKNHLDGKVVLVGNQLNPYRFMKRCDVYLQFSLYEADPLTVREVAVFNKPMLLSDIPGFQRCREVLNNIQLITTSEDAVRLLMQKKTKAAAENNLSNVNNEICRIIDREIFGRQVQE